ncbi:MAG: AIPR family protein [Gemmatimonadota bacterium]|nr:AIPR family protein [Gemmatimonadota bacterium]
MKTVEDEPQNFYFYNNGISAITSKVEEDDSSGELKCENFSIINGAQTFRSISRAYAKLEGRSKEGVKDLAVMIRLTETPNLFKDSDFTERITQYNNTQNAVKISDFRSNDRIQTSLAFYFSQISFLGKKYYYKNKRSKETPRNSIPINLDDFCKTIHSFEKGPADFFGGIKYLYETNPTGGYYFLFGDKESNAILDSISEQMFQTYAAKFFICETARVKFDEEKKSGYQMKRKKNV